VQLHTGGKVNNTCAAFLNSIFCGLETVPFLCLEWHEQSCHDMHRFICIECGNTGCILTACLKAPHIELLTDYWKWRSDLLCFCPQRWLHMTCGYCLQTWQTGAGVQVERNNNLIQGRKSKMIIHSKTMRETNTWELSITCLLGNINNKCWDYSYWESAADSSNFSKNKKIIEQ